MSKLDTAAIRARAEAATPGPWQRECGPVVAVQHTAGGYWTLATFEALEPDGKPSWAVKHRTPEDRDHDNAFFIACARTDVPALCDEVDRLRAVVGALRGRLVTVRGWIANYAIHPHVVSRDLETIDAALRALGEVDRG